MLNFSESGHPIFRASGAFERGELKRKRGDQKSIHFNGSHENIELLLCTVISANQLRSTEDEAPKGIRAPGKPEAPDHLETMEIPIDLSITETNAQQQGTWCKNTSENSNSCQKTRNYPNCYGFETCGKKTKLLYS